MKLSELACHIKRFWVYGSRRKSKVERSFGQRQVSIYEPIRNALRRTGAGIHVKTAGTNWLEELIGLAESGGEGLKLAKEIYVAALDNIDALCAPYADGGRGVRTN